jgi:uncharacterized protein (DUF1501 family)
MRASRRSLLRAALGGGVALGLGGLGLRAARAETGNNLLLAVYFSGGWDQLLALDPRPANQAKYSGAAPYQEGGTGIDPAYDDVNDGWMQDVLADTGGSGVQQAGGLKVGPAFAPELLAHAADLAIVRGINMSTLTHEVGRRFFTTGQLPRGLAPVGSSLASLVAAAEGIDATVPNLSIETESYAVGLPAYASPIQVRDGQDVRDMLRVLGPELAYGKAAIVDHESGDPSCRGEELDGQGHVALHRASRLKALSMVQSGQDALFDFDIANPGTNQALFDRLGITSAADLTGEKGNAAIAAQALSRGVTRGVSVRLASNLDDHDDWANEHPNKIRDGLALLGNLITWLKSQESPFGDGGSTWDHTTLMVFSEFSRTPLLNGRGGRDHHLSSSCLLAGPGLKRGVTVGASSEKGMAPQAMNLSTGDAQPQGGASIGPGDVVKTVLTSMGLGDVPLGNQPLDVIDALLA